ncbi:MAG: ABC transporter ATP-binding protein [Clostridia bacterium]|nr:ABC transporter ATP-binding protein [Clostridia bacterium]MDD4275597.1 ABC transporter ATP-binding protein [Clostridia bacterium]
MLKITNVSKTYSKGLIKAVDNLNLEVKCGEIFGFIGPNGAGKSTTIKMITGILPFEIGTIEVCGIDIKKHPLEAKSCIGYVPDTHSVYEKLTGKEYLNFMADMYNVSLHDRKDRCDEYLKLFNLLDAVNNQIRTYSHGMKQKLIVIGALLHNPKLWILDEPLTGLDPQSSFELKKLMQFHTKDGNTVFFSSHVLEVVEKLVNSIGIINKGKLIFEGDLEKLKKLDKNQSLEEVFLNITKGDNE